MQQWSQYRKRSVFVPIPRKGNAKEYYNYGTIALIPHTSYVILKIVQVSLQRYVNPELSDVPEGFKKGRRNKDQIANIDQMMKNARGF